MSGPVSSRVKRLIIIFCLCLAPVAALADSNLGAARYADVQLSDPAKEQAAKTLMEDIRCLVCAGQSIADSNAEMAGDMRSLIRTRIAAGETPAAIRTWLIDRYGDRISYTPAGSGSALLLWTAPIALLAFGIVMMRGRIRRRKP